MRIVPRQRHRQLLVFLVTVGCCLGVSMWLWTRSRDVPADILTSDGPPGKKLEAVGAIENAPTDSAVAVLANTADDPDPRVAAAALSALGRMLEDAPLAKAAVLNSLDHPESAVRHAAAVSYARIFREGQAEHPEKLIRILKEDPCEDTRAAAAQSLGRLQVFDGLTGLLDATNDSSPKVASEACRAACNILGVRVEFDPSAPVHHRTKSVEYLRSLAARKGLRQMHTDWLHRRRAARSSNQ